MQKFLTVIAIIAILAIAIPSISQIRAASIADNIQQNNPTDNTTSTSSNSNTNNTGEQSMFLTAVPDPAILTRGSTETAHIKAETDNGTALSDVTIQSLVVDYATGKQKIILGGQTDDKGTLDLSTKIGPHSHPGQFLISVVGEHDGFKKSTISTGFAVTTKDSGSSTDSNGKCSGSSCK